MVFRSVFDVCKCEKFRDMDFEVEVVVGGWGGGGGGRWEEFVEVGVTGLFYEDSERVQGGSW